MKSRRYVPATVLGAFVVAAVPALAHHSITAVFDTTKTITLAGTIKKIEWINPHTFVHLDVKDDRGTVSTWALECSPPAFFRRAGVTKEMLMGKPGETVTIEAYPARVEPRSAIINVITYSDGHHYQLRALSDGR